MEQRFDTVIVGAGSAGCVLANRLSADPRRSVLLIEAGPPDRSAFIRVPKGSVCLFDNERFVWRYPIEPPRAGMRLGQGTWIRGRTLGGSSSVNGMMYVRGQPQDYDRWEELGNRGWGWEQMGRCFREMENHQLGDDGIRGGNGPLRVSCRPRRYPLCDALIAAGRTLGLPEREDLNGPDQEGIGYYAMTVRDGRRESAATAFLNPARVRPNLTVMTDALVERIVIEQGRATAVELRLGDGTRMRVAANVEIIVSAGAIESPKLLQLSGIGGGALLRSLGIPVVLDRPDVGRNLREHPVQAMQFRLRQPGGHNRALRMPGVLATLARYLLRRDNVLAACGYEVGVFARSRAGLERPDIQLHFAPFSLESINDTYVPEREPGVQCIGNPLRPDSQGHVEIRSANAQDAPRIVPNYLHSAADRRVMTDMIAFMRRLFAQPPMAALITHETLPGPAVVTEDQVVDCFHRMGQSGFHAVGTCRMGRDADAVVDERLRVRGVSGLRVVDCSVMPEMVSGNTNGPAMALAWRAAELIREDAVASA